MLGLVISGNFWNVHVISGYSRLHQDSSGQIGLCQVSSVYISLCQGSSGCQVMYGYDTLY